LQLLKSEYLSQIICNKCKVTLDQFRSTRKQFIDKQNNLIETVRKIDSTLSKDEESHYEMADSVRPKEEIIETEPYAIQENIQGNFSYSMQQSEEMTVDHEASYEVIGIETNEYEDPGDFLVEVLQPESTIQFSCQICKRSFESKEQLEDHLRNHVNGFSCGKKV
jgi:Zinc-finger double-stranded RNA-binding